MSAPTLQHNAEHQDEWPYRDEPIESTVPEMLLAGARAIQTHEDTLAREYSSEVVEGARADLQKALGEYLMAGAAITDADLREAGSRFKERLDQAGDITLPSDEWTKILPVSPAGDDPEQQQARNAVIERHYKEVTTRPTARAMHRGIALGSDPGERKPDVTVPAVSADLAASALDLSRAEAAAQDNPEELVYADAARWIIAHAEVADGQTEAAYAGRHRAA